MDIKRSAQLSNRIGIVRETKNTWERRVPLIPADLEKLIADFSIEAVIQPSENRIYTDDEYRKIGVRVDEDLSGCDVILGIKEVKVADLIAGKSYLYFSHTIKGQSYNMPMLEACLEKNVTLIDYEKIVDAHGKRLVYFGRFAGICGLVDSLHYLGKKLRWQGINNPFVYIRPAREYKSLAAVKEAMLELDGRIQRKGLNKAISPFIIGITGHGNVSRGVHEVLDLLSPIEVHPRDMLHFIKHQKGTRNGIYKIVFLREEKMRSKDRKGFYFEAYRRHPQRFASNLDKYLQYLNILINGSYWDIQYPRMVTKDMIRRLSKRKSFRLEFINDIS